MLDDVMMLLSHNQPVIIPSDQDGLDLRMEISMHVYHEYSTRHQANSTHPAANSPSAKAEIARRIRQYHQDTPSVPMPTMAHLDDMRAMRRQQEQLDREADYTAGYALKKGAPCASLYEMADPLVAVIRRSTIFMSGCRTPASQHQPALDNKGARRRTSTPNALQPQANLVTSCPGVSLPSAVTQDSGPVTLPSYGRYVPAMSPIVLPAPTHTAAVLEKVEVDSNSMFDHYDYPNPGIVASISGCVDEGSCLTLAVASQGTMGPLACVTAFSPDHNDPRIQQHAKYIRDNAALYMDLSQW